MGFLFVVVVCSFVFLAIAYCRLPSSPSSLLPLPFPVAERVKGKKRKKRSQAHALFNEKKNRFCSSLATHKILFLLVAFPLVWLTVFLSYCPLPPLDPSSNPLQLTPLAAACDTPLPSPPAPRHKSIRERETHVNWCACSFWGVHILFLRTTIADLFSFLLSRPSQHLYLCLCRVLQCQPRISYHWIPRCVGRNEE